ncbi:MAG: transcription-repair coupling factor, partial [Smithellaceae bacterium]|nr:transcription-repair coupling factor [Smithellaceae bacterium]
RPGADFLQELWDHQGQGRLVLCDGHLKNGFYMPLLKLVVISEEEVFGRKTHPRRVKQARAGFFLQSFAELKEGNFVVHTDHGIGIYRGLHKLNIVDNENDYLLLEYLDGDKLYIPVDRLAVIQRYVGPEGYNPKLDKLGGGAWEAARERVKKSIRDIAEELVALYAAREVTQRRPFCPPDSLYEEFCSTFEYEETPDQAKAIEDVALDMDQGKPMDRLICGDAGFGKTEVALRASFRAVMDGKQVALMVPTTILAEQHFQTFSRRFQDFPVRVEVINRFKSRSRQKEILAELERGMVDILIGTHRLLQKDVKFRDLGLAVIDEEQKFGVSHKERLKQLRTQVDVLTLSATPIPRTLHLSLIGIRDLSIISTPPEDRIPIRTYVMEFSEAQIKDAIDEELKRGGQVFFVHNRIHSIHSMSRLIGKLVPEARISVVHGRMAPREIEDEMGRFIRKECDVLVSTSIIGSGIDIPSANTIIVNRADHFGLSQLYQIRGRVGRSGLEASAYLFIPKGAMLSGEARKRLRTMLDFCQPGSGFKIAGNDLEIRGGGSLLGTSQSGHVSAVGYEH